jgi:two-component system phosphate regulon sensor histidine kinase PhoR
MWPAAADLAAQAFLQIARPMVAVDRTGAVLAVNAAAQHLTGWKASDAIGRPCADILEVRTEEGVSLSARHGALQEALEQGRVVEAPQALLLRLRTADDPVRVSFTVSPLKQEGTVHGAVILFEDLTPALEAGRAKDALILAASHEIKTPLTALRANSELLLDFELTESQRREVAGEIHTQVARMEKLFDDILSVSRIDSGRLPLDLGRVRLRRVLDHVCAELRPMLGDRKLNVEIDEPLPPVIGEEKKLHQILINLGTNAIKYSPPQSVVALTVRTERERVRIELRDQGVGIRKEDQKRVFEKFFRVNDPAVRRVRGTGLGLYIVRSLVEMLGGRVEVKSRYGHGASFVVWLPRAEPEAARAAPVPRRRGARAVARVLTTAR